MYNRSVTVTYAESWSTVFGGQTRVLSPCSMCAGDRQCQEKERIYGHGEFHCWVGVDWS
jgi:hypothetical protein